MAARWPPRPATSLRQPGEAGRHRLPAGQGGRISPKLIQQRAKIVRPVVQGIWPANRIHSRSWPHAGRHGRPGNYSGQPKLATVGCRPATAARGVTEARWSSPVGTLEKLMVSQQFARGLSQPNPLPLLYPRGIPPSQEFLQFSVWFSTTFWRTSENPCDMQFCQVFAQKRWFRPRRRTGVVFSTDGPNLGLFMWGPHGGVPRGPRGIPVGPGPAARPWPVIRRFYARFSPFSPFFARFASFS